MPDTPLTPSSYDICRSVELSARYFWTISPVQIYPELKRLEAAGLLTGRDDPRSARRRRTYKLTDTGHGTLRAWLENDDEPTIELRDLGMLKLFFADATDNDVAIAYVQTLAERSARMVDRFRTEIEPAAEAHAATTGKRFPLLTARLGREQSQ